MILLIDKPYFAHTICVRQRENGKGKTIDQISGIPDHVLHLLCVQLCRPTLLVNTSMSLGLMSRGRTSSWRKLVRFSQDFHLLRTRSCVKHCLPSVGLKLSCRSASLESSSNIQMLSTSEKYCSVTVMTPGICIEYISWVILMYHLLGITKLQF